ncbi:hypothetical protein [Cohnella faecalis]|uniref:Uncharacterized protein n=1 Tax=Cohnella faecalis TaxID=2315694 RepID=A0A398CT14_9BACL|nr:hypothetical protein [Cohnella faecalis]RIE05300.1 hypothetical protein D3H35_01360 [Cohnella faecalis]
MEMGNLAIVNEPSVRKRRETYGVNSFQGYIEETLSRLRIPFQAFESLQAALEWKPDILIPALCEENADNGQKLQDYVEAAALSSPMLD